MKTVVPVTVFSLKSGQVARLKKENWTHEALEKSPETVFNPAQFLYEIDDAVVPNNKGKKLCVFYLQDSCRFGGKCRAAHPIELKTIDKICLLCGQEIRRNGASFGLMLTCSHSFCVGCIKSWNKSNCSGKVYRCPVCGSRSQGIISSVLWVEDRQTKSEVFEEVSRQKVGKPDHSGKSTLQVDS